MSWEFWPQYVYLSLLLYQVIEHIGKDGQLKPRREYNGFMAVFASAFVGWILWRGGFFEGVF